MFPSEFTMEVEFSGASSTNNWSRLVWAFESSISTDNVLVSLQLYNYTQSGFSMGGDGYIKFISSVISETDEMKSQVINGNPMDFRDSMGNWKVKVQGAKNTTSEFYFFDDKLENNEEERCDCIRDFKIKNISLKKYLENKFKVESK